jgi:magnesium-transporting ATPase (P-type)
MAKIGKALQTVQVEGTPLQLEVGRLVRQLAVLGLSLCALVVILYGIVRSGWLEGFLAGITLAMAVLPEEFPVVLTVFLALGAWRLSKKNVLTRQGSGNFAKKRLLLSLPMPRPQSSPSPEKKLDTEFSSRCAACEPITAARHAICESPRRTIGEAKPITGP